MSVYILNKKNKNYIEESCLMMIFYVIDKNENIKKEIKIIEDFAFIYNNKKLLSINIFNYEKYFNNLKEGFHFVNDEMKQILLNKFSFLTKNDLDSFIKIGLVKEISKLENSNNLNLLTFKTNTNEEFKIITNVLNLKVNKYYLFIFEGGLTYFNQIISNTKILSISSNAMLLSYKNIGILDKEGPIEMNGINDEINF